MHCKLCLNNDNIEGITFSHGICSVCQEYKRIKAYVENYSALEKVWKKKLYEIRGTKTFDAVIGLSGGKDSTYVLYELKRKYNLNVCCVTFDNGYLSDTAKENIDKTVKKLDIYHEYVVFDKKLLKTVYDISQSIYGNQCMGCTFLMYVGLNEFAIEHDVALMLNGRSSYQIYSKLGMIKNEPFDKIYRYNSEIGHMIDLYYPNFSKISSVPYYSYFMFHEYDEDTIISLLENELGWASEYRGNHREEHFDCINHKKAYELFYKQNKYEQNLLEISHMIRVNKMNIDEAKKYLRESNCF